MAGDKETLLSMGFDPARVEWALKATGNRGLQPAMDHILEHEGHPVPDASAITETTATGGNRADEDEDDEDAEALKALGVATGTAIEAKSIKCSECGKIFKNTALANYHAEKSGHDQFEESTEELKPLTEEERKQRLAELRERMAEKRSKKAVEEAKEQKANETLRRKAGKDMNKIKEDLKVKEAIKEAEARKRVKDARARAAVKAQIEADKKARAEKAAREKALRDGNPLPRSATPVETTTPTAVAAAAGGAREYKETRLQIRMSTGGSPYTTTLSSDAPLREVAEYLAGQTLSVDVETVTFSTNFPRKTYTHSDFSTSLKDLGLSPSAVLIATP
ncbi:DNA-binding protein [Cyathus striatus]|nr:DNA-binding protein [Cyathus striatus]